MSPILTNFGRGGDPEDWILPIEYRQETGSSDPVVSKYWMWVESTSATGRSHWVLVIVE